MSSPEWKIRPLWRAHGTVHWSGRPHYSFDLFVPALSLDEAASRVKIRFGKEANVRFSSISQVGELLLVDGKS